MPRKGYSGQNRRELPARGFTLIELLVVLVILGLLAGLVGPRVMKHVGDSKTRAAALQIEELSAALDIYRLEIGHYPSSSQGLQALVQAPDDQPDWNGPYLRKQTVPKDPWNHEFHYRSPGEHGEFDLFSFGADNAAGGEAENADLVSWQ